LSLPQLLVYHCSTAVLSVGAVQEVAHTVVRAPPDAAQTFLQKQAHALREEPELPPHVDCAWVRMEQDWPHEGRLPMPCLRSCAEVSGGRRAGRRTARVDVVAPNFIAANVGQ
jgi:hypothetical protein